MLNALHFVHALQVESKQVYFLLRDFDNEHWIVVRLSRHRCSNVICFRSAETRVFGVSINKFEMLSIVHIEPHGYCF